MTAPLSLKLDVLLKQLNTVISQVTVRVIYDLTTYMCMCVI